MDHFTAAVDHHAFSGVCRAHIYLAGISHSLPPEAAVLSADLIRDSPDRSAVSDPDSVNLIKIGIEKHLR